MSVKVSRWLEILIDLWAPLEARRRQTGAAVSVRSGAIRLPAAGTAGLRSFSSAPLSLAARGVRQRGGGGRKKEKKQCFGGERKKNLSDISVWEAGCL